MIETQKIGATSPIIPEVLKMSPVIQARSNRNSKQIAARNIFGIHQNKATTEISGIFRCGRFHHQHIVQLRRWNNIERKSTRVGFRTRYGTIVNPYIIIPL